ncbi:hypothetical protein F5141DRAFT_1070432 [Pisolithus sp. B1]|nr:hypothetical protein F5141DRAFT_1070432 [Pisolithus sp. B1]
MFKSVQRRAYYLDRSFSVCGLRVGWAVVIGLIPDIGDFANRKARQAEFPEWPVRRMLPNLIVSGTVYDFVPGVGDVVVGMYKANFRNAQLLEEFLKAQTGAQNGTGSPVLAHSVALPGMVCDGLFDQPASNNKGWCRFGTVLGFIISYPTTPSFERYHEGRTLWSQIVFASRTFARAVWFHVPDDAMPNVPDLTNEERKSRTLIEKKTVINLLEAYAVHHLPSRNATLFHRTAKDALAVGLTSIHEASTDLDAVEFYKQ